MSFQNVEAAISLLGLLALSRSFLIKCPVFCCCYCCCFSFIQVQFRVTHVLGEIPCSLLSLLLCSSHSSLQFSSVAQSYPTLCDTMNHSTPGLPVHPISRSSLRLTSIESVMPSSHLIFCHPFLLLPPIPPNIRSFPVSQLLHEVAKVLEFQL